jgi:hypothetical protein
VVSVDAFMTCSRCGAELVVGDFPFCKGNPSDHGRGFATVHGDECDFVQKNGTKVPIRFRSKQEHARWMKENHLNVVHDWKGSGCDPYTMNNVRVLLERRFLEQTPDEAPPHMNIRTYTGELSPQEAEKYSGQTK